jgi:hypothetical protein
VPAGLRVDQEAVEVEDRRVRASVHAVQSAASFDVPIVQPHSAGDSVGRGP